MKVKLPAFEINDHVRRAIRARDGRGGRASRKEAAVFLQVAVRTAVEMLPPPKVRAPKRAEVDRRAFARAACSCTEEVLCVACRDARRRIARQHGHAEVTRTARREVA